MNANDRFSTIGYEMKDSSYNEFSLYICVTCGAAIDSDSRKHHHEWHNATEVLQVELKEFIKNVREFMDLVKKGVRVQ